MSVFLATFDQKINITHNITIIRIIFSQQMLFIFEKYKNVLFLRLKYMQVLCISIILFTIWC